LQNIWEIIDNLQNNAKILSTERRKNV